MSQSTYLLASALTMIYLFVTSVVSTIFAIWWSKSTLLNFAVKMLFVFMAISGIILLLFTLGLLEFNITWVASPHV